MKKVLLTASYMILTMAQVVSASGRDQLPQSTVEGQAISIVQSSITGASTDISAYDADVLKTGFISSYRVESEELSHQALSTNLLAKGILDVFNSGETIGSKTITNRESTVINVSDISSNPASNAYRASQILVTKAETDDLSHQSLAAVIQEKDNFYYVKTGGAVPLLDKSFRKFLNYGASVSFGVGKRIDEHLSLIVALDAMMLTGDWSIGGSRQSVEVASESWDPTTFGQGGQTTIIAEDLNPVNEGVGYSNGGTYQITSSESLKQIDVHTDFYIFPITLNALYKFDQIGKISPYLGGGLGYCIATRDSDSKVIKNKYFAGPDYFISLNNFQTVNGLLLQLLGGMSIPIYNKLKFVAEANATWYDLKTFDPILEISIAKTPNPTTIGGNDVTTYSYENPKHIGVFSEVFVANMAVGLVMPF